MHGEMEFLYQRFNLLIFIIYRLDVLSKVSVSEFCWPELSLRTHLVEYLHVKQEVLGFNPIWTPFQLTWKN